MTIEQMHYEFRILYNGIDSNKSRGWQIPEIDHLLNKGQTKFINDIIENDRGEDGMWAITALSPLVTTATFSVNTSQPTFTITKPTDFMYVWGVEVTARKGDCVKKIPAYQVQVDDIHEYSPFSKSNFEWEEVNYEIVGDTLKFYVDGFTVTRVYLTYLRQPQYIHYAQTGYNLPDGTLLTGKQDCELPPQTHYKIVELSITN